MKERNNMIYRSFKDIKLSMLGMGNMRLPALNPQDPKSPIDFKKAHEIIDRAYEAGINYFDTAYVYNDGESEKCVGEAMKKYPRESFYLATKYNLRNPDYVEEFEESLAHLQTDYIDFYLIHAIGDGTAKKFIENGSIEYFKKQKELGRIKYLGFSSHASTKVLKEFAEYTDWDFCQLQVNYYDWVNSTSKEEVEIINALNIPIIVMEPVRGGVLANLTPEASAMLKEAKPECSVSSWAFRFLKDIPGITVILSGMSTMEQLEDNLVTFSGEDCLSDGEKETLFKACEAFRNQFIVPCTACRYCCSPCVMEINIPDYMKLYNAYKLDGPFALQGAAKIETKGKPSDCIGCGMCMKACPQVIDIPKIMEEFKELLK